MRVAASSASLSVEVLQELVCGELDLFVPEGRQYCVGSSLREGWEDRGHGSLLSIPRFPGAACALVRSRRGLHAKDIELLALRYELELLRRQVAAEA